MVAHCPEALRDVAEQRRAVVEHLAEPAVHDLGRVHDAPAMQMADALVTEADTQERDARVRMASRERPKSARLSGRPGPGEITMLS